MVLAKIQRKKTQFSTAVVCMVMVLGGISCGKGSGKNIEIPGVDGPRLHFIENQILLSLTLKEITLDGGGRLPFPKMDNSFIEVGPDLKSSGYLLQVGLSLQDLQKILKDEAQTITPRTLPGGRPLPGVAQGQLPAIALTIPKLNNMAFYVGPEIFGFFVPVTFPKEMKGFMATYRFYDADESPVGNISVIGGDSNNQNGGVLMLFPIQGKTQQKMTAATPLP